MVLTLFSVSIDRTNLSVFSSPKRPTGEVIQGLDLVKKIESLGSTSGSTKKKVVIAESGTV